MSGISFLYEVLPAPAKAVAAKQGKHQGTEWQYVVGYDKVPKIQPCRARCKGLEMQDAVAEGSRQRQDKDAGAADKAAFFA